MNDELRPPASSAGPSSAVDNDESNVALTASELAERRRKNRDMFNRKRGDLLDDLLTNLDILIYAQLTIIYYKDCSFFRFLVRVFPQLMFLGPKAPVFPEPAIARPYIGRIVGTNLLCMLLHIFGSAPFAGEETRGYLHGGLAMDFIGEKGPTSRWMLLLLDFVVLFLQILYMTVHILRQRLKGKTPLRTTVRTTAESSTDENASDETALPSQGQNIDDEERGVRRSAEQERSEDIEMRDLNPGNGQPADEDEETSARESLLAATEARPRTDAYLFDAFNSGQIVVADLDIWRTVKEQFWSYQKSLVQPPSIQADRAAGERWAGQMMRWRLAPRNDARLV